MEYCKHNNLATEHFPKRKPSFWIDETDHWKDHTFFFILSLIMSGGLGGIPFLLMKVLG